MTQRNWECSHYAAARCQSHYHANYQEQVNCMCELEVKAIGIVLHPVLNIRSSEAASHYSDVPTLFKDFNMICSSTPKH